MLLLFVGSGVEEEEVAIIQQVRGSNPCKDGNL